ncbi:MAG: M55 family metallopeptidase [Gemmatimonadetes bacterium]|nr:M55 family metallopeptidase [Gemmatimonadota bacterium]
MHISSLTRFPIRLAAILPLAAILTAAPPAAAQEGLKIYISADMEGVVGTVTSEQLGPSGFEYERARRWMTEEVNAAIRGARAAGATEILISDSHGNGQNLLLDELPEDVRVIRSWPRPLGMMAGIDDTFDGAIFIGYHASTNNSMGVRAHTMSSARLTSVKLNGMPVPETGLNAAVAGYFGVPVIMISGDDVIAEEATALIGEIETAVVKQAYGFHSAETLMPAAAYRLIEETAARAVGKIGIFEPWDLGGPVELEVSFKNYRPVEALEYLEIVERIDSHTIRYTGPDMIAVSNFLTFLLNYDSSAQP